MTAVFLDPAHTLVFVEQGDSPVVLAAIDLPVGMTPLPFNHWCCDPVPETISRRQFYQALAEQGTIAQGEALAAMQGVVPAPLLALVDTLFESVRFPAKMLLAGATVFERSHPLCGTFAQAQGWDAATFLNFWLRASRL